MPTPTIRELDPPSFVDGALVRLVTDGEWVWVQQWSRDAQTWLDGAAEGIDEVMKVGPASEKTRALFGYPVTEPR
jgi:hypothetical protein